MHCCQAIGVMTAHFVLGAADSHTWHLCKCLTFVHSTHVGLLLGSSLGSLVGPSRSWTVHTWLGALGVHFQHPSLCSMWCLRWNQLKAFCILSHLLLLLHPSLTSCKLAGLEPLPTFQPGATRWNFCGHVAALTRQFLQGVF